MQPQTPTSAPTNNTNDCLSASELVHRHLQNKDHQISDEELQKISIDCDDIPAVTSGKVSLPDETSIALNASAINDEQPQKEEKQDVILTPLDVIH